MFLELYENFFILFFFIFLFFLVLDGEFFYFLALDVVVYKCNGRL